MILAPVFFETPYTCTCSLDKGENIVCGVMCLQIVYKYIKNAYRIHGITKAINFSVGICAHNILIIFTNIITFGK